MAAKHRRYAGEFHAVAARNRRVAMRTDDIDASAAICELADALDAAADMVAMQGQAEALVGEILKA